MKTQSNFEKLIKQNQSLLGIDQKQYEFTGEAGRSKSGSNKETENGFHYSDFEYVQFFNIEELPNRSFALLIILVQQFVNGLGEREGLQEIDFEFGPHDKGKSMDVEITFGVRESVYLVPVDNSPIEFNGKKWGFGESEYYIAQSLGALSVNA